MEGLIVNFRGGKHTKYDNHMIVKIEGIVNRENAAKMIGQQVLWETPSGKKIIGRISVPHGNSGNVRVIFEKGMPGQSIAKTVKVM